MILSQETQKELNEMIAKRQKKGKVEEERTVEEKTTLHINDPTDYQVDTNGLIDNSKLYEIKESFK